jgi:hypothetical protein
MKKIAYTRPDGGVSIVVPVISINDPQGFTEDDALARALGKDIPADAADARVIEDSDIPQDRAFRNAWKQTGGKVDVNMPKARDIQREKLRAARAPLLAALDVEFMRALEAGKPTAAIVAEKNRLRDITSDPRIEAAQTPEQLKAIIL